MAFAEACIYDGTNDYWTRGAALTGITDAKQFTVQFWFDTANSGTSMIVMRSDVGRFDVRRESSDRLRFIAKNASNTIICDLQSDSTYASGLHHCVCSVDLSAGTAKMMVDGVDDLQAGAILTDDTIDFTDGSDFGVGANDNGNNNFIGELAAIFFQAGTYQDVEADITKWYSGGGQVDLGSDGSTPLGVQPILFVNSTAATLNASGTNLGTGGDGTVTGSLADGTDPADAGGFSTAAQTLPGLSQSAYAGTTETPTIRGSRTAPLQSFSAEAHRREIAETANLAVAGKTNNVGEVTLTANALATPVTDTRVSPQSHIGLTPVTKNALAAVPTTLVWQRLDGSFTLLHDDNTQTDRKFSYAVIG